MSSSDVKHACELLSTTAEVTLPPPAIGTGTMTLGNAITQARPGPASDVSIYLRPDQSAELGEVERVVEQLAGVEVVAVLDQEAVYREFEALFAENEQLVESVDPDHLPAAVRVVLGSDADYEAVEAVLGDDERIYEIVDEYGLKSGAIETTANQFSREFEELEAITEGDLREAIVVLRSDEGPSRRELPGTLTAVTEFLDEECDTPT